MGKYQELAHFTLRHTLEMLERHYSVLSRGLGVLQLLIQRVGYIAV